MSFRSLPPPKGVRTEDLIKVTYDKADYYSHASYETLNN